MPREVPNQGFSKFGRKGNGGWEAKKWKVEYRLGFAIVVWSSEWERDMKGLYCESQVGVTVWDCELVMGGREGLKGN